MASDIHKDDDSFGKALGSTSTKTKFSGILIEKDYYCTLLLEYLSSKCPNLVFKGGTCLSKVYADFYRLSEDLDFSITPAGRGNRTSRSNQMKPFEQIFSDLPKVLDCFQIGQGLRGERVKTLWRYHKLPIFIKRRFRTYAGNPRQFIAGDSRRMS